jgi:hypothetical protein
VNPYTSETVDHQQTSHWQDNVYVAPVMTNQYQPEQQQEYQTEQQQPQQAEYHQPAAAFAPVAAEQSYAEHEAPRELHTSTNNGSGGANVLAVNSGPARSEPQPAHEMEAPVPMSEDASLLADTPVTDTFPVRPVDKNTRTDSVQTISNLHIPGEYPRNSIY